MKLPDKYTDIVALRPGQNGAVYRARNILLDREVFLKVYEIPESDPLSALREPQALEELEHASLTRIYSADVLGNGHLLLEMELLSDGSFKDLIDVCAESGEWISVKEAVRLVIDAATGLGHLHNSGFVHRDVKPANLMRSVGGRAKVTDLGLASRLDGNGKAYASEHSRLYRPPEIWGGHGYTPSSDVYQLGIVLFQLLGGELDYAMPTRVCRTRSWLG